MKKTLFPFFAVIVVVMLVSGCGPSSKLPISERQQLVHDMESETLAKFYQENSSLKKEVQDAAGYGVFSNANVNIIFVSGGGGYGIVTDNTTGKKTYMKMGLGGIGLGLGAKDYRQLLIFKSKVTLNNFIESGWEFGGHADAAAKAGESGGELSGAGAIGSGIEAYSLTESGLALQATVAGTKYWQDGDLN